MVLIWFCLMTLQFGQLYFENERQLITCTVFSHKHFTQSKRTRGIRLFNCISKHFITDRTAANLLIIISLTLQVSFSIDIKRKKNKKKDKIGYKRKYNLHIYLGVISKDTKSGYNRKIQMVTFCAQRLQILESLGCVEMLHYKKIQYEFSSKDTFNPQLNKKRF